MRVFCGDEDGVGGDGPPEGVGHGADDAQRVQERNVVEVDLDALGGVVGIEEHIDAGGLADGLVDDLGVLGHVQRERLVRDGLELDGRSRWSPAAHCSPAGCGSGDLGVGGIWPCCLANFGDLLLGGLVAGIDFGGVQELGESARQCRRPAASFRPLVRCVRRRVVRMRSMAVRKRRSLGLRCTAFW